MEQQQEICSEGPRYQILLFVFSYLFHKWISKSLVYSVTLTLSKLPMWGIYSTHGATAGALRWGPRWQAPPAGWWWAGAPGTRPHLHSHTRTRSARPSHICPAGLGAAPEWCSCLCPMSSGWSLWCCNLLSKPKTAYGKKISVLIWLLKSRKELCSPNKHSQRWQPGSRWHAGDVTF